MQSKLRGELTLTYVNGGISKESKRPYLQMSDGVEAKFVSIPKAMAGDVTPETFARFERGDLITIQCEVDPFASRITLLELPEAE